MRQLLRCLTKEEEGRLAQQEQEETFTLSLEENIDDKGGEERGLAQQGGGGEGEEVENKLQLCDDVGQQTLAAAEVEGEEA